MSRKENKARILFVDDDPELLQSIKLNLRKEFRVETALSGREGLQKIADLGPFAIVVSDMRMPVMNGARFLSAVNEVAPDTVRILLTGETDLDSAVLAVNNGAIFRFLKKPCEKEALLAALEAGVEQFRLATSERDLLETTLRASVQLLMEILGHMHPEAFSQSERIQQVVAHLASVLKLPETWAFEIAGMLAHIGYVTVPSSTVEKFCAQAPLEPWEQKLLERHPHIGQEMVARIPRLESVARMIARQRTPAKADEMKGIPMRWEPEVLGGELIRLAAAFERQISRGAQNEQALEHLRSSDAPFPEALLRYLDGYQLGLDGMVSASLMFDQLAPGMVTREEIRSKAGGMLAVAGQKLNSTLLERLKNFEQSSGIQQPIQVLSPTHLLSSQESA